MDSGIIWRLENTASEPDYRYQSMKPYVNYAHAGMQSGSCGNEKCGTTGVPIY